jgi:alcohol dehydrogenase class IV
MTRLLVFMARLLVFGNLRGIAGKSYATMVFRLGAEQRASLLRAGPRPERHVRAARLLAPAAEQPSDPAESLPRVLNELMRDIEIPNGVAAVGYTAGDIPALVEGTLKQQRLLATSPKPVTEDDLVAIFERSMELW